MKTASGWSKSARCLAVRIFNSTIRTNLFTAVCNCTVGRGAVDRHEGRNSLLSLTKKQFKTMKHIIQQYTRSFALVLFLAVGLGLTSMPAIGQASISPGVKVGGNLGTLGGEDAELVFSTGMQQDVSLDRRTGYAFGAFALIDFAGPFALQPELMYIQKGAKTEMEFSLGGQSTTVTSTMKLDYIQVPLLMKLNLPVAGPVSPNVFAGPNVGFNINASQETEAGGQSDSEDIGDDISGTDYGVTLGAGIDFGLSAGTLTVDVRYELGLADIPDEGDANIRNRGIGVTAGLAF